MRFIVRGKDRLAGQVSRTSFRRFVSRSPRAKEERPLTHAERSTCGFSASHQDEREQTAARSPARRRRAPLAQAGVC